MTASAPRPCIDQRRSAIPLAEGVLARISEAAMSVAIISLFQDGGSPLSAWATTLWIALEALRQTRSLPWSWGLVAILLLNLRGIVRSDGPQPISHMDWVLIIAAFLVGFGRSSLAWRRSAALACCACMAGVLLKGPEVWEFAWWGIAYKLPTLTQNQTALLAGFCTMAGIQALLLGRRRIWLLLMVPCVVGCLVLVRATSSRAGLGLVPISLLLALAVNGRSQLWNWSSQWLRKAWPWLLPLPWIGLAGLLLLRGVRWSQLASLYGSENALNDLGRIHVYRCYLGLPFLGENRLLYGVGYQNSWAEMVHGRSDWPSPEPCPQPAAADLGRHRSDFFGIRAGLPGPDAAAPVAERKGFSHEKPRRPGHQQRIYLFAWLQYGGTRDDESPDSDGSVRILSGIDFLQRSTPQSTSRLTTPLRAAN